MQLKILYLDWLGDALWPLGDRHSDQVIIQGHHTGTNVEGQPTAISAAPSISGITIQVHLEATRNFSSAPRASAVLIL